MRCCRLYIIVRSVARVTRERSRLNATAMIRAMTRSLMSCALMMPMLGSGTQYGTRQAARHGRLQEPRWAGTRACSCMRGFRSAAPIEDGLLRGWRDVQDFALSRQGRRVVFTSDHAFLVASLGLLRELSPSIGKNQVLDTSFRSIEDRAVKRRPDLGSCDT